MQIMTNYQFAVRNNRPKAFTAKHLLQVTLFVAFGLWLLYQVRLSYTKRIVNGESSETGVSNERMFNMLGRKGSAGGGISKSTHRVDSGVTLDDVTNPVEEGEIVKASTDIDEVEFQLRKNEDELSKVGNVDNALVDAVKNETNEMGTLTKMESNVPVDPGSNEFPDENGIPQHVRDKFVKSGSTQSSGNGTRVVVQSVIVTDARNASRGAQEDS